MKLERDVMEGAAAGAVAALALYGVERVEKTLLREPPPYTSSAIARGLLRAFSPSPRTASAVGFILRAGYGMTLGALYAATRRHTRSAALRVPAFGLGVCAFELALMPRVGATRPLSCWPRGARALLGLHATSFAAATELLLRRV